MRVFCSLALALALAVGGCTGDIDIVSGTGAEALSTIVVIDEPGGLRLQALADGPYSYQVQTAETVRVTLFEYRSSLEELGLTPGALMLAEHPLSGLILPPPDVIRIASSEGPGFEVTTTLPPALMDLQILVPSIAECALGGGCQVERKVDGAAICRTPCPAPSPPAPPLATKPPVLTPCPPGWVQTGRQSEDDVDECEPWLTAQTCTTGQMQVPGDAECKAIGAACTQDGWPTDLPDSGPLYFVRADAGANGLGTRASPFASLDAVPTTDTGTVVIALGPGTYSGRGAWPAQVEVRGACTESVILQDGLLIQAKSLSLQDLKIEGPIVLQSTAALALRGVHLQGGQGQVIAATGARMILERVLVQSSVGGTLLATGGADITVSESRLEGVGLVCRGASRATINDVSVHGAESAIEVTEQCVASLQRTALLDSARRAIISSDMGSRVELQDVVAASSSPATQALVAAIDESSLTGQRVRISGAKRLGLTVEGGHANISDLVIRDTAADPPTSLNALALQARDGADVTLRRVHLVRSEGRGLAAFAPATQVFATDLSVLDTRPRRDDGELGTGVEIENHAEFVVDRLHLSRSRGVGLFVDDGATMSGNDVFVQEVLPRASNGGYGRGMEISDGSRVDLTRVKIDRAKNVGLLALDRGTEVILFDLSVTNTERSECFGFSCNTAIADGVISMLEASVEVKRFLIADNLQYGLRVVNRSRLHVEDGLVSGHPVGAQIIVDDFDLLEITRNVTFSDNVLAFSFLAP